MKKILALTIVFLMGIASVSIVSSQNPCEYVPPSECQECMDNFYSQAPLDADFLPFDSFFFCQRLWFHPYWMEIYDGNVKGCYARDLVCYNDLPPTIAVRSEGQNDCYLYGEPMPTSYPQYQDSKNGIPPLVINIPSCNNSRAFFQSPPPCAGEGDASAYDRKLINSCCFDMRGCGINPSLECAVPCSGYTMPANYKCDVNEYVIMKILGHEYFTINGVTYCNQVPSKSQLDGLPKGIGLLGDLGFNGSICPSMIVWYNGERPFDPTPGVVMIQGVPRTITIEDGYLTFTLEQKCCYDCKPKPSLPQQSFTQR